jgi:adenylylsulfate kinase
VTPRAILVSGPVGSGKTTVLLALDELLAERPESYALVDLDWLCWVRPAADAALTPRAALSTNLAAVWETYRRAGVERLVLARAVASAEKLETIKDALSGVDVFVVHLVVPRTTLEARLRARDSGEQLSEHLAMLDEAPASAAHEVDADRAPAEVARDILAHAGW